MEKENIIVDDELQHNYARYQLLVSIYEKIDLTMDLEEIFKVVFSELLPVIEGESGIIQIISSDERKSYYGYHNKKGIAFWEPSETIPCPDFMSEIINTISKAMPEIKDKVIFCLPNMVYAKIHREKQQIGYAAIYFNPVTTQSLNEQIVDFIKAVVNQIVIIINQKRNLKEKIHFEELSLLETVLSALVHDMKNPLSGISGFVQLIEQKSEDDSIIKYCGIILDSLTQLEKISSEFHTLFSGRTLKLNKSEVSLPVFLTEFVDKLMETYKHAGIDILFESKEEIWITADQEKLKKVFKNIFKNAKEAMPESGTIHITLRKNDSYAEIEISDTGKGMPSHIQEYIFEPFITYGKKNATGLGMAVAQRIIQGHGGTISVASFLGKGTVFTINLPLA